MTKHQEEITAYIVGSIVGLLIIIGVFTFTYFKMENVC